VGADIAPDRVIGADDDIDLNDEDAETVDEHPVATERHSARAGATQHGRTAWSIGPKEMAVARKTAQLQRKARRTRRAGPQGEQA
jgi:hypothetical protein